MNHAGLAIISHTSLCRDVCDGLLLGFSERGQGDFRYVSGNCLESVMRPSVLLEREADGGNWPPPQQFVRPLHLPPMMVTLQLVCSRLPPLDFPICYCFFCPMGLGSQRWPSSARPQKECNDEQRVVTFKFPNKKKSKKKSPFID